MQLQLNGWNVQPKELVLGVKGSYGCDSLTIAFSPEWEELEKIVVFDAGSEAGAIHVAMMDGSTVEIPQQVMKKSGICPIVIYGMAQGKARYSVAVMGVVLDCPKIDGEEALPVEPALWEQYLNEISQQRQQAQQAAEQAEESEQNASLSQQICEEKSVVAQDAARSAEMSAQNAADLVKKYPIVKNGTWWIWNFDAQEYLDTQVPAEGPQGEKGDTGAVGPQGPQGEKGDRGAVGPQGPQGEKGDTGEIGPQGPQGEKGDTGEIGPQGPQGEKGDTGAVGPQGPQGEKGDTGEIGPQGPQGEKGDTGAVGPQGPQGEKGDTGAVGPQGPQGEKGDTGAVGPQGPQGEKGDTGAVGPQGPQGEKGDTGAVGPQGPQGEKGDTGAVGPQGPQGEKGDTGAVGPQGPKGEKGDTGAVGPQGPQGEKGDTGAVGPQGPQGEKGDTGAVGPQGPQGEKGDTGAVGPQGPKGDTGPQGVAGPAGPNAVSSSTTVSGFTSGYYLYNNNGRVGAKAITAATIGAAAASHTHTKSQITDFPIFAGNNNLLDNSLFSDPINQRGQNFYEASAGQNKACIDRWIIQGGTYNTQTKIFTGISSPNEYGCYIRQALEGRILNVGDRITFSAKINNEVFSFTEQLRQMSGSSSATQPFSVQKTWGGVKIYKTSDEIIVAIYANKSTSITIDWVKLETGNQATAYVGKSKPEELLNCYRYYYVVDVRVRQNTTSSDYPDILTVSFPTEMRIVPTVTLQKSYGNDLTAAANSRQFATLTLPTRTAFVDGAYKLIANSDYA